MPVSQQSLIREMTPEELHQHARAIYQRHRGDMQAFTMDEHRQFKECRDNYLQQTGKRLDVDAVNV